MLGGCRVHILIRDFSFSNDQNSRPSNFLSQIARDSGAISFRRFLQEKTTSRLLFERTRTRLVSPSEARETRSFRVQPWNARWLVDAGPTRFPCDMTTSHGPWSGPRTETGKGATTSIPNPSRIGQTSRAPKWKYLLNFDQNTFFGSD
jgi:hypothetical protein